MIVCKLSERLGRIRMNVKELSDKTGIPYRTLLKIYNEQTKLMKLGAINEICKTLDCKIDDLFEYIPD